ncbi:MAG: PIN domain-containing protein, partial [Candidatus Thermoplasmatota archaeon]|nr:PIN domain-containing protein [Candidatus Thermoplasmatota archaeon]
VKASIVVSVITIGEFYPKAEADEMKAFNKLLNRFPIIPLDFETAKIAGLYRKKYLRKTKKVFLLDCFLAGQAKVHNLTLVTNNTADFPMKDIEIISPQKLK